MHPEIIKTIESKVKDLPTLPSVALRVMEIANNPEATIEDLKKVISTDQVVSSRVLKLVNSAYFGFPRQIDTLSKAIVILGFNNIRALVLSVSIMEMYRVKASGKRLKYADVWRHAVGTAFTARALALCTMPRLTDQCFAAGLLHDIGIIIIDRCFPANYIRVMELAEKKHIPFFDAEREVLGYTHCDVGAYVTRKWLLPPTITEAIAHHHAPDTESEYARIILATHAADIVTKTRKFGDYGDNEPYSLDSLHPEARSLFHVHDDFPPGVLESIDIELQEAESLLSIVR